MRSEAIPRENAENALTKIVELVAFDLHSGPFKQNFDVNEQDL